VLTRGYGGWLPPVVILFLHASVALPALTRFSGDILRVSLCDLVLRRTSIAPLTCLSIPARYSLLRLLPTRHPYKVEPGVQPSGVRHACVFFPTARRRLSRRGAAVGDEGPDYQNGVCLDALQIKSTRRGIVFFPALRLDSPYAGCISPFATAPRTRSPLCCTWQSASGQSRATKTKARRRSRMANQRWNISCKALGLQPIRC